MAPIGTKRENAPFGERRDAPGRIKTILSIGQDDFLLETRNQILRSAGYVVESVSAREAAHRIQAGDFDLVLLCHSILAEERYDLACRVRDSNSPVPVASIAHSLYRPDDFTDANINPAPNRLLSEIAEVLARRANISAEERGKDAISDSDSDSRVHHDASVSQDQTTCR